MPTSGLAGFLAAERRVEHLLSSTLQTLPSQTTQIRGATVIPRFDEPASGPMDVTVVDGAIASIEPTGAARGAGWIDGTGRWLVGGLVDAHVHTQLSVRQDVLNVLAGVTGVREMCGFPWMSAIRAAIASGDRLAPRMMMAGHILADHPLDGYATVITTPEEARARVIEQAAAGVDAIKVHNRLARPLYDAVAVAAEAAGLPLVGHIPHHISVSDAVRAGQVTFEHLKGYYNDWNLEIAADDWVGATRDGAVWNCPTLVTSREGSRGDDARRRLATRAATLMDPRLVAEWKRLIDAPRDHAQDLILERSRFVIAALTQVTDRWLTGTDASGGIAFLVPGEAMHEEMTLMEEAGIPRTQVLHASTHALAECHPGLGFSARVGIGEPADFLLLDADPRQGIDAYGRLAGVCLGGRWLGRDDLDRLESGVRAIDEEHLTDADRADLLAETAEASPNHWHRALAAGLLGRTSSVTGPIPNDWP